MRTIVRNALIAIAITSGSAQVVADSLRTGQTAFGDWHQDAPGVARQIAVDALPAPFATRSTAQMASVIAQPAGASPQVPAGFKVSVFASGLQQPRTMRTAPNGDIFVAEVGSNRIQILRPNAGTAKPASTSTFAADVDLPFGIAFWPPGPAPKFVYLGLADRVVRYPYQLGDLQARGPAEIVVHNLPTGGHWTRDVVFSLDGTRMFVAVGSSGNINPGLTGPPAANLAVGAAWADDLNRADVLAFAPNGSGQTVYATGLRNCSAEAVQPATGALWCVVNERDGLGDNLPPDYATHVKAGGFYGWPWFYLGPHPDPRIKAERADLASQVTVPDVLMQAHSAPLGIVFYDGKQFPEAYRGDAFVALRGSWNRSSRTGYKVVRLLLKDGHATGVYEDFLTGFVASDQAVWGRPVGLTVMLDGSLLVSEDANGTIWRVTNQASP